MEEITEAVLYQIKAILLDHVDIIYFDDDYDATTKTVNTADEEKWDVGREFLFVAKEPLDTGYESRLNLIESENTIGHSDNHNYCGISAETNTPRYRVLTCTPCQCR